MMKGGVVLILFLALIFIGPWLTYLSFTTLVHSSGFGIAEWFSTLWLMIALGGAASVASK